MRSSSVITPIHQTIMSEELYTPHTPNNDMDNSPIRHSHAKTNSCGSGTLRSITSARSNHTASTTICHTPDPQTDDDDDDEDDVHDDVDLDDNVDPGRGESAKSVHASFLPPKLLPKDKDIHPDDVDGETMLRHYYKGPPPEPYPCKKIDKQLVLQNSKGGLKMSTHWHQNKCLWGLVSLLMSAVIIFFIYSHKQEHSLPLHSNTTVYRAPPPRQYMIHNDTPVVDWRSENDDFEHIQDIGDDNLSDFVTPIKVQYYSLNDVDLLYESNRDSGSNISQTDSSSAFSMTGTFRNKSSPIWDPHPQYILKMFGRVFNLILYQDTSFIPMSTFRILRILNNNTEEADDSEMEESGHYLGCYYKGNVKGDQLSAVAVSLCNGMTGYIKTGFGTLLIQPVNQTSSDEVLHRVWRHSQRNARHAVSEFDIHLEALELSEWGREPHPLPELIPVPQELQDLPKTTKLTRHKRHYNEDIDNQVYTLEVLVAVDSSMKQFHKDHLTAYILTLFSIVSNIFSDASIGNAIRIALVKMILFPYDNSKFNSSNAMLNDFCQYIMKNNFHYDAAILITRERICGGVSDAHCHMLGLAEFGTVCNAARSCSIVQDTGLPTAFTMSHELGHILNMPHDDEDHCKPYNTRPGLNSSALHVMASVMGDGMHPWSWSKCSQHFVSELLEKSDKSCLLSTEPQMNLMVDKNSKLPGEIYSLDRQCQLIYTHSSSYCQMDDECRRLWCNDPSGHCRSTSLPWADGSPCHNGLNWCQKGKCVPKHGGSLHVINGGWGPWTPFTYCSLSCGGGVQESNRECNSPMPENGGKYCSGSRKKYRSCNTHKCPPGSVDPREQQCSDMNGKHLDIQGITRSYSRNSKWVPKYGLGPLDKCKLYCRLSDDLAYFMLEPEVKDGTTCSFDSFDKCVNGICRPAGCDNELNSIAKMDKCGVCEGRNDTCEELTGNVYVSDLLKKKNEGQTLFYATTIPKGASNIVITQPGYPEQNYIVVRDDKRGVLLNSEELVVPFPKNISYSGVTIHYSGSNSTIERVYTTISWKLKRDLIIEIISVDLSPAKRQDTSLLTYTYIMDKPKSAETEVEIYRWEMQTWSICDSLCQGRSYRQPACVSTIKGLKVAPQFCDATAKPKMEDRLCNMDCRLTLNVSGISECSAACGELGTREKNYNCIQTFPDIHRSNIVDMSYCQVKFEITRHEECREGCWKLSEWSACSQSCGTGFQFRELKCYLNGSPVSEELCNLRTKPQTQMRDMRRNCHMDECRSWLAGEWGQCDDWCKKSRTVTCSGPYGRGCDLDKKPIEVRNCCQIKYTSEWEECSVKCGMGYRRRIQNCSRVYKPEVQGTPKRRVYISDSYCVSRNVRKPKLRKTIKTCKINCGWIESSWSQCPADCSSHYMTRYINCVVKGGKHNGNPVDKNLCDAKCRPLEKKKCSHCMHRDYKMEYKVTVPCNCEGYERRRSVCYNSQRKRVACPFRTKYDKQKCTPPPSCRNAISRRIGSSSSSSSSRTIVSRASDSQSPQSCSDLQRINRVYEDGEYWLVIRSRQIRVYCYRMNSRTPREYITVQPQENYSIYYENKTHRMDSCPTESREHEYYNPENSGRTYFSKLRLNVTNLRIIENDFEFAETRGQRQKLGSSGDCYNRNMQCPQGDFSINIERTGFIIRPGTVWNKLGNRVVMHRTAGFDTAKFSRRAFCGGYCGSCSISSTAGLYLDVA